MVFPVNDADFICWVLYKGVKNYTKMTERYWNQHDIAKKCVDDMCQYFHKMGIFTWSMTDMEYIRTSRWYRNEITQRNKMHMKLIRCNYIRDLYLLRLQNYVAKLCETPGINKKDCQSWLLF